VSLAPATEPAASAPAPAAGGYRQEGARDLRFDFLRGFAVLAMVVDHIGGPSWLYALTGGNKFYTSAAEAFIFISGLLVGIVYGRVALRDGLEAGMSRALRRAGVLYLLTVSVTLPLLVISELLELPWATGVYLHDPLAIIVGVLTLHRTYYLIDVMLLYTLLLALAPVALYLLVRGQTRVLLAASWLLWLAFQIAPDQAEIPWPIVGNYLFFFSAWQVLFFTAMVLGFHRDRLARWFPPRVQRVLLVLSGLGFAGLVVLYRLGDSVWQWLPVDHPAFADPNSLVVFLFGKGDVRPGRVVASAIVFGFFFLLVTQCWRPLYRGLGWLLLPLGQNALYAYTAHIVLVVLLGIALLPFSMVDRQLPWLNTLLQLFGLAVIWVLVKRRWFFPSPQARVRWALVSSGLAVAVLLAIPPGLTPSQAGREEPPPQVVSSRRMANPFGTPVPRGMVGAPPPGIEAQALPEPRRPATARGVGGSNALPEYVGPIRGRFLEQSFYSRALRREMFYFIYLPSEYDTAWRAYPVLYLLHGASGAVEEWPAMGIIDALDRAIESHEFEPFIVVLPEGFFGFWVNHAWGGPRWGDYVTQDLVMHIDNTYRTLRRPYRRAIGGLSFGATGALVQAFTYPDVFGIVGAHSPALRENSEGVPFLGEGEEFAARDPVSLAYTMPGLDQLQIWIDVGDEDGWYPRAEALHRALLERGIPHEWHVWPGDHSLEYTGSHILDYLRFYSRALYRR